MHPYAILLPLIAQIVLTLIVWVTMYITRFREIHRKRIPADAFRSALEGQRLLTDSAPAADNLRNLFEMPVLFYVAILLLYVTVLADTAYLILAWSYVLARAIHSFCHIALQRVPLRFFAYVVSTLILWIIWLRIGVTVVTAPWVTSG